MKKILFVHHGRGIGGAPRSMLKLVDRLSKEGNRIKIIFLYNSDVISLFEEYDYDVINIPTKYFNHNSTWYQWYKVHVLLYQFISFLITIFFIAPLWLIREKPDVTYLNSSVLIDWSISARFLGFKNVLHVRESIAQGSFGIRKKIIKSILNYAPNKIFFLSNHNYKILKTKKEKSTIVHNYVSRFNYNIKDEKVYDFIYVGGEKEIKGIDLIRKFIQFNGDKYKICLLGYYSEEFIDKFKSSNIDIIGITDDPIFYIKKSKSLIFPATTPHFPRPVIEAFSCGTIPIASKLEGIEEILEDKVDGFLFEKDNLDSLYECIDKLKGAYQQSVVKNGIKTFKERFSITNEDILVENILH